MILRRLLPLVVATAAVAGSVVLPSQAATPQHPELWTVRFNGRADLNDSASSVATAGNRVFVTGASTTGPRFPEPFDTNIVTIAYRADTGRRLWQKEYDGKSRAEDSAAEIATAPDGSVVYVTGSSVRQKELDIVTIAYEARSGRTLWASRYEGLVREDELAVGLVVSGDGSSLFVTGNAQSDADADLVTIAYDAADGVQRWVARSLGAGSIEVGQAITQASDGSTVFVTGHTQTDTAFDYLTVAYDATTGTQRWTATDDGPAHLADGALAAIADGANVYVTGESASSTGLFDYLTIAYDGATGTRLWSRRYAGPGGRDDIAWDIGVAPDASQVYVTGASVGTGGGFDYETLAYATSTGETGWRARYAPGPGDDVACCVAPSLDGSTVYVAGTAVYGAAGSATLDFGLVAYDAITGTRLWLAHHDGPVGGHDHAHGLAVDAAHVFVTGDGPGRLAGLGPLDYDTVAYRI